MARSCYPGSELELLTSLGALRERLRQERDIDLVLLDYSLGDGDAESVLPELAPLPCKVVVVSALEDPAVILRVMAAGAVGFVPKSAALETMKEALAQVIAGEVFVPELVPRDEERTSAKASAPSPATQGGRLAIKLTTRQCEVADLVASGFTNREIREELKISENTVKTHLRAVFVALEVSNRTEAAVEWLRIRG